MMWKAAVDVIWVLNNRIFSIREKNGSKNQRHDMKQTYLHWLSSEWSSVLFSLSGRVTRDARDTLQNNEMIKWRLLMNDETPQMRIKLGMIYTTTW